LRRRGLQGLKLPELRHVAARKVLQDLGVVGRQKGRCGNTDGKQRCQPAGEARAVAPAKYSLVHQRFLIAL
jgi:hypothetical protein